MIGDSGEPWFCILGSPFDHPFHCPSVKGSEQGKASPVLQGKACRGFSLTNMNHDSAFPTDGAFGRDDDRKLTDLQAQTETHRFVESDSILFEPRCASPSCPSWCDLPKEVNVSRWVGGWVGGWWSWFKGEP